MKKIKEMEYEPLKMFIICKFPMPVPDININVSFDLFNKRFFKHCFISAQKRYCFN